MIPEESFLADAMIPEGFHYLADAMIPEGFHYLADAMIPEGFFNKLLNFGIIVKNAPLSGASAIY